MTPILKHISVLLAMIWLFAACQTSKITQTAPFPIIAVQQNGVWIAYDNQNEKIFQLPDAIIDIGIFRSDLALVTLEELDILSNRKKAVLNIKGKLLESPNIDSFILVDFHQAGKNTYFELQSPLQTGPNNTSVNKTILIDQKGKKIANQPCQVLRFLGDDLVAGHNNELALWIESKKWEFWSLKNQKKLFELDAEQIGRSGDGLIPFSRSGKWGFVDHKGNVKISPQFSNTSVEVIPDYGYIKGYLEAEVDYAGWVEGSSAAQDGNGKWGLINKKGQWVLAPEYVDCLYSGDVHWSFKKNENSWILVNKKGEQANDITFFQPLRLYNGIFRYHHVIPETDSTLEIVEAGARKANGDWVFKHYYEVGWDTVWAANAENCYGEFVEDESRKENCICRSILKGVYTNAKGISTTVNNFAVGAFVQRFKSSRFRPVMMGEGYFMFYTGLDYEPVVFNAQGGILTHLGMYENGLSIGHFSNGLAAVRYFNEETKAYQLGFLNKEGEWNIKLGTIKCPQDSIDDIPQASRGLIKVKVKDMVYFYDHNGKLLRKFDYNNEDNDWERVSVLQAIPKAWPRD